MERYTKVELASKTTGAEIYYTVDGSLPALHHEATRVGHMEVNIYLMFQKDWVPNFCDK